MGSFGLTRAHRKKRRYCDGDDEFELTIYAMACPVCHEKAEKMSHAEMFKTINEAIEKRNHE